MLLLSFILLPTVIKVLLHFFYLQVNQLEWSAYGMLFVHWLTWARAFFSAAMISALSLWSLLAVTSPSSLLSRAFFSDSRTFTLSCNSYTTKCAYPCWLLNILSFSLSLSLALSLSLHSSHAWFFCCFHRHGFRFPWDTLSWRPVLCPLSSTPFFFFLQQQATDSFIAKNTKRDKGLVPCPFWYS